MNDKKQQLLEASIDLFAAEGFWNTPTARIAKHAGVATGTLFNYFPSKDALIDAVYRQLKREWRQHIVVGYPENGDVKSCLEHIWFRFIDWGVRYPARYSLMEQLRLSDTLSPATVEQQAEDIAFVLELIQRGFVDGLFKEMTIDYFTSVVLAELDATVRYAVAGELRDMALAKLIALSFDIFWDGVTK
ncbi:MAG: TetR/AcrR family transcriptional regulator [Caldilineaceae bacterium]|nr:TetR/AcrR family transcriptional regulator [Caldilineaceae bacterium]